MSAPVSLIWSIQSSTRRIRLSCTPSLYSGAQLAMHSCFETAGAKDTDYLIQAMTAFYGASFREEGGRRRRSGRRA